MINNEFETDRTYAVTRAKRICNPADKNDEDPTAATDRDHLVGYKIKRRGARFQPVLDYALDNQFGPIVVDVIRPEFLMVPTGKTHGDAPPPPDYVDPGVDHFTCYRVTNARLRKFDVKVVDQFGELIVDLKRPARLCVPTDKNGEGIYDAETKLMCYLARPKSYKPPGKIHYDNQFGPGTLPVFRPTELCVPSVRVAE